jgi:hypothetical protein
MTAALGAQLGFDFMNMNPSHRGGHWWTDIVSKGASREATELEFSHKVFLLPECNAFPGKQP